MHVSEKMHYHTKIKWWLLKKSKFFKIFYGTAFVSILLFVNIEYSLMHGEWDNGTKKSTIGGGAQQSIEPLLVTTSL